jgi:hypothetical protein
MWYWILGGVIVILLVVVGFLIAVLRGFGEIVDGFIHSFWK